MTEQNIIEWMKEQKIAEEGYKEEDVDRFINSILTPEFLNKLKKVLTKDSVLLPMPSTSKRNKIPLRLAQKIHQKLGTALIIEPVVVPISVVETKKLRGVEKLKSLAYLSPSSSAPLAPPLIITVTFLKF